MDAFVLKLIAIAAMAVDHAGFAFFPHMPVLRIIGRLTMPVMCFFLAQGVHYTRSVPKYAFRLALFAILSEIPFDLALSGRTINMAHQNVLFTLLLGLFAAAGIRFAMQKLPVSQILRYAAAFGWVVLAAFAAECMKTDYASHGVLLVAALYVLRERRLAQMAAIVLFAVAGGVDTTSQGVQMSLQLYAALAVLPLFLYNGKRGASMKYMFYAFYPAHLALIALLRALPAIL